MFTGIVQAVGRIGVVEKRGGDCRYEVALDSLSNESLALGDSVSVNGVCLTVVALNDDDDGVRSMTADVSAETLGCTTLCELTPGDRVNLELALTPTTRLGGHLVSGHVDGIAEVISRQADARSERLGFRVPAALARYVAAKGSICVDGVSLTINQVTADTFDVNVVPHTVENTTLGRCQPGVRVNIEIDVIARYLERMLQFGSSEDLSNTSDMLLARVSAIATDSPAVS